MKKKRTQGDYFAKLKIKQHFVRVLKVIDNKKSFSICHNYKRDEYGDKDGIKLTDKSDLKQVMVYDKEKSLK